MSAISRYSAKNANLIGTKRKHTGLTNSEYEKELVRINVLEEKLYLWWKLQFAAQDAKI